MSSIFYFLFNSIRVGVHIQFLLLQTSSTIFWAIAKFAVQNVLKEVVIRRNEKTPPHTSARFSVIRKFTIKLIFVR